MNQKLVISLVVLALAAGAAWYLYRGAPALTETGTFGTYTYQCDSGAHFAMTLSADVSSAQIAPGEGASFAAATLVRSSAASTRFEAPGMYFVGAGEEVALTVGNTLMICNPTPNPDEPPFNWGDPSEGGSTKQDAAVVVYESIVGTWKSVDDAKYVREFRSGGVVADLYEGREVSTGTYQAYTSARPLDVPFPLEPNTVYLRLVMSGTQADALNFKVAKLTPDELELVYMERGGVLRFTSVK